MIPSASIATREALVQFARLRKSTRRHLHQVHVDSVLNYELTKLPLDEWTERVITPMITALNLEIPYDAVFCHAKFDLPLACAGASEMYSGIAMRGLEDYDIMTDAVLFRLDIMFWSKTYSRILWRRRLQRKIGEFFRNLFWTNESIVGQ